MRRTLLIIASGALLVACGDASVEEEVDIRADFAVSAEQALAEAKAAGASEDQIAEIEQAIATGEITLEAARASVDRVVACFEEAGLTATVSERTGSNGVTTPGYSVAAGDDATTALMEKCESLENFWTNMLYQTQPAADEANWAYIETQMPAIVACFEEEGYPAEQGLSAQELMDHALAVIVETDGLVNCTYRFGIDHW